MKLRKKREKKKITRTRIKESYLRELSKELIKRGISNNEIKNLLDEVAISLDEFISETKPTNIEDLEKNFGSVEQFCENNLLLHSKEGALGQTLYNIIIVLSVLAVPFLGFASFFIYPYNNIILGFKEGIMGVTIASLGNGFIGTLFGLNIFTWMLYQLFKNRFSKYDIREKIKTVILILYWLIFSLWLVLASLPYTMFASVIIEIWQQGFRFLILNSALRWLAIGIFLGVTALLYTFEYRHISKNKSKNKNNNRESVLNNLKICLVFFILVGFVVPNPGMGLLLIFIGIQTLLFARITGGTWLIGGLAILSQIAVLLHNQLVMISIEARQIIFGLSIDFGSINPRKITLITLGISLVLFVIWTSISLYSIRKRKEKILPRISLPKKKNVIISMLLLLVVLFAALGTKPQYTFISSDVEVERLPDTNPDTFRNIYSLTYTYNIPSRGDIYISIYTYLEYNNTKRGEYNLLDGNWTVRFNTHSFFPVYHQTGSFSTEPTLTHNVKDCKIGLSYFRFDAKHGGKLEIVLEFDLLFLEGRLAFPQVNLIWVADNPLFPSFIEIAIVTLIMCSFFLTWKKKEVIKPTTNSKEEGT